MEDLNKLDANPAPETQGLNVGMYTLGDIARLVNRPIATVYGAIRKLRVQLYQMDSTRKPNLKVNGIKETDLSRVKAILDMTRKRPGITHHKEAAHKAHKEAERRETQRVTPPADESLNAVLDRLEALAKRYEAKARALRESIKALKESVS